MALAQLLMGIGAPLSGGLIDKFGAGRIIVICVLAAIAGLYFLYAATTTTDLLISGVLMGIGVSGTGVTVAGRHHRPAGAAREAADAPSPRSAWLRASAASSRCP